MHLPVAPVDVLPRTRADLGLYLSGSIDLSQVGQRIGWVGSGRARTLRL